MGKQPRYTDKFRASAVAMLVSLGYPDNAEKLKEVSEHLKVPGRTLRRWFQRESNPPPDDIVQQEKRDLADVYEDIARTYLTHAGQPDVVDSVSGNAAITAAAIATDKMRLLKGLPTEIVAIMPALVTALEENGLKPAEVFNRMIARLAEQKAQVEAAADDDRS